MRFQLACLVAFVEFQALALPINLPPPQSLFSDRVTRENDVAYNFEGIVGLSNCSGALFRFEHSLDTDKAMVMSNGHCVPRNSSSGFIPPGEFVYQEAASRSFTLLSTDGRRDAGRVQASKLLYATMTGTDVSIYELKQSFQDIKNTYDVDAFVLDSQRPSAQDEIEILSGYWRRGYACTIEKFVFSMREDAYSWTDSIRYSSTGCQTVHGTSGSPIISKATRKIIGVNNTGSDNGARCTMNNPCEVDEQGNITVSKGASYGQQTYQIYSCLDANGKFDLSVEGCQLLN